MIKNIAEIRKQIRQGVHTVDTVGFAPDYVQANIVIIPKKYAFDFLSFCQANPKPCPLIGVSEAGQYDSPHIANNLDIRTDLPSYHVYQSGQLAEVRTDIQSFWQNDLVTFFIGCSFSFEQQLVDQGIALKHHDQGKNVAMFDTSIKLKKCGVFAGQMVVSMRPMVASDAIRAIQITSSMPRVHGAPVHIGNPSLIGITELSSPEYGDAIDISDNELPVFWACGVTAIAAVKAAKLPLAITHSPGCMLITDIKNHQLCY